MEHTISIAQLLCSRKRVLRRLEAGKHGMLLTLCCLPTARCSLSWLQFWIRQKMCQIASSSYLAWPLTWISADKNGLSGVNGGGTEFMSMKYSPNRLTCSVM